MTEEEADGADNRCLFSFTDEGRCWHLAGPNGYCSRHIRDSPEEIVACDVLNRQIHMAKTKLDAIGEHILKAYILFADDPIPEELRRDYRNSWYRWNYLTNVRNTRTPGAPLPAEVTMPAPSEESS